MATMTTYMDGKTGSIKCMTLANLE